MKTFKYNWSINGQVINNAEYKCEDREHLESHIKEIGGELLGILEEKEIEEKKEKVVQPTNKFDSEGNVIPDENGNVVPDDHFINNVVITMKKFNQIKAEMEQDNKKLVRTVIICGIVLLVCMILSACSGNGSNYGDKTPFQEFTGTLATFSLVGGFIAIVIQWLLLGGASFEDEPIGTLLFLLRAELPNTYMKCQYKFIDENGKQFDDSNLEHYNPDNLEKEHFERNCRLAASFGLGIALGHYGSKFARGYDTTNYAQEKGEDNGSWRNGQ